MVDVVVVLEVVVVVLMVVVVVVVVAIVEVEVEFSCTWPNVKREPTNTTHTQTCETFYIRGR